MVELANWVKAHRSLKEWEWFNDAETLQLFIYLLLTANFKPNRWRGIDVPAGALITSTQKLADRLGSTRQKIRTSINRLKSTNEITIKTTNKFTLIQVVNWAKYQSANQQTNQQPNHQVTNNQPTTNHTIRKKECKKERNNKLSKDNLSKAPKTKKQPSEDITNLLLALKQILKIDDFTETEKQQRRSASTMLKWMQGRENGGREFKRRLNLLAENKYKQNRLNSIVSLYREIKAFRDEQKNSSEKITSFGFNKSA